MRPGPSPEPPETSGRTCRIIRDLRGRLGQAVADGAGRTIQFEPGEVELEVSPALERSGEGRRGVFLGRGTGTGSRRSTLPTRLAPALVAAGPRWPLHRPMGRR
ncbi:trypco2 family protein [Kitasatospora cathayae]|uniref:trypco2 family protein n=1 Tax=Kitasatospora cathayae TaxID=3004092 RepID=UPI003860300F